MGDNTRTQGKFRGVNKLCQQCQKECKQFENVKVIRCNFTSKPHTKKQATPSSTPNNDFIEAKQ